jgi:hypothetical protein
MDIIDIILFCSSNNIKEDGPAPTTSGTKWIIKFSKILVGAKY